MTISIESALLSVINNYKSIPLVVAYSGGVDSQVLLHAIAKLWHAKKITNPITVCHVNHGLSENATSWQNFAQQTCLKLNIPFVARQVSIQLQAQKSLEALARDARYKVLQSLYKEQSLVITGHHRDDQAETFLLALKRGSGLKGLSAMADESLHGKDIFMRPLLDISRKEIVNYAKEQKLTWVEDESNCDTQFDRNFIRQKVMPLLSERWPSITQTINRSSSLCSEGQSLLDELAEQDLQSCQLTKQSLSVNILSSLSIARFNNLIRYFLAQHNCLMPSAEQLRQVHQQLLADENKNPEISVANNYLRRYRDGLYLTRDLTDVSSWAININQLDVHLDKAVNVVELPDNLGQIIFSCNQQDNLSGLCQNLSLPHSTDNITLKFCHTNPTCLPDYRNHSRSLKKILQELNIPPWQRKRIPFLYYGDTLVAAIGYFVCKNFLAKKNEPSINVHWKQK